MAEGDKQLNVDSIIQRLLEGTRARAPYVRRLVGEW